VADFLIGPVKSSAKPGTPMYDPLAVGVAIDSALVRLRDACGRRDSGDSRAARQWRTGAAPTSATFCIIFPDGDRYVIEASTKWNPTRKSCTEVNAEKVSADVCKPHSGK